MIDLAPNLDELSGLCPFARIIGQPCPTCGASRAVVDLLTLDPLGALRHNALVVLALTLVVLVMLIRWRAVVASARSAAPWRAAARKANLALTRHPRIAVALLVCTWGWNLGRW